MSAFAMRPETRADDALWVTRPTRAPKTKPGLVTDDLESAPAGVAAEPEAIQGALGHYAEPASAVTQGNQEQAKLAETAGEVAEEKAPASYNVKDYDTPAKLATIKDANVRLAVRNARVAYQKNLEDEAEIIISTSKGGDGAPVAVLVPKGFDKDKPAKLDTFFHGLAGNVSNSVADGGLSGRVGELQKWDTQRIFVLPECRNPKFGTPGGITPSHTKEEGGMDWSNIKDLGRIQRDALKIAGARGGVEKGGYTVSAHSGGGAALAQVMRRQLDAEEGVKGAPSTVPTFNCDYLEVLDCIGYPGVPKTVGGKLQARKVEDTIAEWGRKHGGEVTEVMGVRGSPRQSDAEDFDKLRDAFGEKYHHVELADEPNKKAPEDIDPVTNKPHPRWIEDHGRAKHQWLGRARERVDKLPDDYLFDDDWGLF